MTPELLREAIACESIQAGNYMPAGLRMRTMMRQGRPPDEIRRFVDQPFLVSIETPFSQIADMVIEAKRRFLPLPEFTIEQAQKLMPRVRVSAGKEWSKMRSVENVVIKRGGEVIKPISADVSVSDYHNAMNASRTVKEGTFAFPLDAFSPTGDIVIVVVGETENAEYPLSALELRQLH